MSDLIRDAVRYAEGWRLSDDTEPLIYFDDGADGLSFMSWSYPDWMKDLLAAQLVRQIDATSRYFVITSEDYCDIVDSHMSTVGDRLAVQYKGDDRTENTIRAAVEFYRSRDE